MKTYLYRASNLKSTTTFLLLFYSRSQFLAPTKNCCFLRFFYNHNNFFHQFLQTGFLSEYTEANAISLIPLDTTLPE